MTENESIKELETSIDLAKMCTQNYERKREIQGYEMAINALKEIQKYRKIGTPEECRAAVEKQIPKKIIHPGCYDNDGIWRTWNGIDDVPYDLCPSCETNLCTSGAFGRDKKRMKYCENCGQKLDWRDEE